MNYNFMRMILFFDLPTVTKAERKIYSKFRKALIEKGFMMMQFSVYCKIYANRDSAMNDRKNIKRIAPENGNIRILIVTEKQYASIEIIIGGLSNQEKIVTEDDMLIL